MDIQGTTLLIGATITGCMALVMANRLRRGTLHGFMAIAILFVLILCAALFMALFVRFFGQGESGGGLRSRQDQQGRKAAAEAVGDLWRAGASPVWITWKEDAHELVIGSGAHTVRIRCGEQTASSQLGMAIKGIFGVPFPDNPPRTVFMSESGPLPPLPIRHVINQHLLQSAIRLRQSDGHLEEP